MKTYLPILLIMALVGLLILSACNKDKDNNPTGIPDISPANYDWDIYFISVDGQDKSDSYILLINYLGNPNNLAPGDVYQVEVGAQNLNLMGHMGTYYSYVNLTAGEEYSVKFKKNNSVLSSANLKMPYKTNTQFPANYVPTNAATMNWTLQTNNEYQFAGVEAYDWNSEDDDDYIVVLNNSARSATIPANAVDDFGSQATYSLMVTQMNFKKNGRFAFSSISSETKDYGYLPAKQNRNDLIRLARKLRAQID